MTRLRVGSAALVAMSGLLVAGWADAAVSPLVDRIERIDVEPSTTGSRVIVHGTRAPVFSVFRLNAPERIVLDLSGADVSATRLPSGAELRGLAPLSVVQFQNASGHVGRVVLQASADTRYDVQVRGDDVVVALAEGKAPEARQSVSKVLEARTEAAPPVTAAAAPTGAARLVTADPSLVERRVETRDVERAGHRVLSVRAELRDGEPRVDIRTDGPVASYTVLRLKDPPRLALDLQGFTARGAKLHAGKGVRGIRFGKNPDGLRIVLDVDAAEIPAMVEKLGAAGLALRAVTPSKGAPLASVRAAAKPSIAPSVAPPLGAPAQVPAKNLARVRDLRIAQEAGGERVIVELEGGAAALPQVRSDGQGEFELSLDGVLLPKSLQRTLDASAFSGPVSTVSSFNDGRRATKVVVKAVAQAQQELRRSGDRLTWTFVSPAPTVESQAKAAVAVTPPVRVEESAGQAAGFATAVATAGDAAPSRPRYTGRRVSMEFKDIDIQNLLRLFAEISHRNIVVSDDVKGKVTIALRNVPWDQAFDLILKTHGLGKEEVGNIIRVAPEAVLEKEQKEALDAQKARQQLAPLKVRLIPVNYALASDVADKIKDVLSDRGVVTVDQRTNVLIVKDVVENLAKAEGMVRNLDTQTPQVLIESRIVEAATTYSREMGIQWGGNGGFSPATANPTGLVFPSYATVAGAAGEAPNAGTAMNPNFAVNLPAAIGPGSGGGLGFIFGSAGGAFNLNLRLSALENNGLVKTVSAPKVATLDNQEATISQGLSIPFAQVSAAGVQTAFIEARLELKVTPHVTADGSILMKINATNNQPNSGITGANGQPSISRKEAKTQMLVKDGDTTVIGGIYTRQTGLSINEVPFLGKIPILGWLFKHRADSDNRTELLIFITPRILNRQQVVSAGAGG